jgi:predicted nucleotidyltransferase
MVPKGLLERIKSTIREIEPAATIVMYGSRARGDARPESDWDFLVLLPGTVDDARADAIRHRVYEIEWDSGEVLTCVIRSRTEWDSPRYRPVPFRENVQREGVVL